MARTAAAGDFQIDVDGIGRFTFARRAPRDVFRIRAEYEDLTGGSYTVEGQFKDWSALAFATIKVLTVQAPDGFDPDKFDPNVDDDWEAKLLRIFTDLRAKEWSFRPGSGAGSEATGEGATPKL